MTSTNQPGLLTPPRRGWHEKVLSDTRKKIPPSPCVCVCMCEISGDITNSGSVQSVSEANLLQNVSFTSCLSCRGVTCQWCSKWSWLKLLTKCTSLTQQKSIHVSFLPSFSTFYLSSFHAYIREEKTGRMEKKKRATGWGQTRLNNHEILCQVSIIVQRIAAERSILLHCGHWRFPTLESFKGSQGTLFGYKYLTMSTAAQGDRF